MSCLRHPYWFLAALGVCLFAVLPGRAAPAPGEDDAGWRVLWQGDRRPGWRILGFGGDGGVTLTNGVMTLGRGMPLTGLVYTNAVPRMDYEIECEVQRVSGHDFPCGLTFPVGEACCTFVFGGWGGQITGLSSINDLDASENSTGQYCAIENGRWYPLRIRVRPERIEVWLDGKRIIDQEIAGRRIGLRPGAIEMCRPLGLASYQTVGAVRGLRLRPVPSP